ncbi:MAG: SEC-C metal-binding domain-containing protein, partial [Desulfurivibrionaceae bacterium]
FFENAINITLSGNKSGPCPNCGGMGHVPDGVFNFIDSTIEILSAPQRTIKELSRLAQIFREAKAKQQSTEQVATQIKEELPGLSSLADLLPKNRAELYGFLALVVATVQLLTPAPQQPAQNITINVSQVVEQTLSSAPTTKATPQAILQSKKKIGRNEPCPCGSRKRYKKCCGGLKHSGITP